MIQKCIEYIKVENFTRNYIIVEELWIFFDLNLLFLLQTADSKHHKHD